jgi:RimJ/RimL family protein N-acetyltransferase
VATVIVVWRLVTARLVMTPVAAGDLRDLAALKAHPRAFGQMLGGVRSWVQSVEELAEDIRAWGEFGFGMWAVRARDGGRFLGVAGLMHRADGRGVALRFAFWPKARGIGAAREAASAALFYAHDTAGLEQVVAVAREDNFASRTIIGSLGMVEIERFNRDGNSLLVYESFRQRTGG